MLDLFDAYNGIGHEDPAFTNAVPASISDTEKAARAMFDQYLTDLGGSGYKCAADTAMVKATGQVRKVKMGRKQDTSVSVSMDLTLVQDRYKPFRTCHESDR